MNSMTVLCSKVARVAGCAACFFIAGSDSARAQSLVDDFGNASSWTSGSPSQGWRLYSGWQHGRTAWKSSQISAQVEAGTGTTFARLKLSASTTSASTTSAGLFDGAELARHNPSRHNNDPGQGEAPPAPGEAKEITARVRVGQLTANGLSALSRGVVASPYLYLRHSGTSTTYDSDECDLEYIGNFDGVGSAPGNNTLLLTNWNNWKRNIADNSDASGMAYDNEVNHSSRRNSVPGLDSSQWHWVRFRWENRNGLFTMKWLVSTQATDQLSSVTSWQLARTSSVATPNQPQVLHFNIWAPDAGWGEAHSASVAGENALDVDKVFVQSVSAGAEMTPPSVSLPSLTAGYSYRSFSSLQVSASDASGIAQVWGRIQRTSDGAFWDGARWLALATEVRGAWDGSQWRLPCPSGSWGDGKYFVRSWALDGAGNTGSSASGNTAFSIFIDDNAPSVSIWYPTASHSITASSSGIATLTTSGSASDAIGVNTANGTASVTQARLQDSQGRSWTGSAWSTTTTNLPARPQWNNGSWTLALPPLPPGSYVLTIATRDYVGNEGASQSSFTVAPFVSSPSA
jgi:hypothetical protein